MNENDVKLTFVSFPDGQTEYVVVSRNELTHEQELEAWSMIQKGESIHDGLLPIVFLDVADAEQHRSEINRRVLARVRPR